MVIERESGLVRDVRNIAHAAWLLYLAIMDCFSRKYAGRTLNSLGAASVA